MSSLNFKGWLLMQFTHSEVGAPVALLLNLLYCRLKLLYYKVYS